MTEVAAGERGAGRRAKVAERAVREARLTTWALFAGVTVAIVAGIAIRLTRLGDKVLSFDEAYTFATAQRSFVGMLETFRFEANGTLYAVLLWPLLRISESEEMIRTLAAFAGIATIPAVYWTGRALADRRAALIAAALVACSPALIGWSVYGRAYAFAILFATLAFGCLARALDEPSRARTWRRLYVACALATAYSSVLAAVVLLPIHAAAIAWRVRDRRGLGAWSRASLALGAGLVPLAVLLYVESTYRDPLAWLWEPDVALVRRVGGELTAGPAFFGTAGPGLAGAIVATLVAIVLAGLVLNLRGRRRPDWHTGVLLAWALFPPLFLLLASEVRPTFWGRYLGIVVPAFALVFAALIVRMPRGLGAVYGIVLGTVLLTASLADSPPFNDFRKKAAWVEERRAPADALVLYPIEQLPALAYYARTLRVEGKVPVEEWDDTPLPAGVHGYRRDYDWGDSPVGPPRPDEMIRLASATGSVLVLTYPNLLAEVPSAWGVARGCDIEHARFPGLNGVGFRQCEATAP